MSKHCKGFPSGCAEVPSTLGHRALEDERVSFVQRSYERAVPLRDGPFLFLPSWRETNEAVLRYGLYQKVPLHRECD